jgi:hypothetical protein
MKNLKVHLVISAHFLESPVTWGFLFMVLLNSHFVAGKSIRLMASENII